MDKMSTGMKVALVIMLVAFAYLTAVTFLPMPPLGAEHSKTIVGFLLGTVFSTIMQYYWGSSSKNVNASSIIEEKAKREAACLETERIDEAKKEAEKVESKRLEEAKITAINVIKEAKDETDTK